jgi:CRISPR-associated protein Csb2
MSEASGISAFRIDAGLQRGVDALTLARALRRAVLARVQACVGASTPLPTFFTGHEKSGEGPNVANHAHVSFVCDLAEARLLILAPHVVGRRAPSGGGLLAAIGE